jgi:hypothetical protein
MLKLIVPLLALGSACTSASADSFSDEKGDKQSVSDFLYAIRQVESGGRYDAPVGRLGELGAYQFRREVWFQHTCAPFSQARTAFADEVAARHYRWIGDSLRAAGLPLTPWNLAAAWNCGVTGVRTGRIPRKTRDYAFRVQNIVEHEAELLRTLTAQFKIAPPPSVATAVSQQVVAVGQ